MLQQRDQCRRIQMTMSRQDFDHLGDAIGLDIGFDLFPFMSPVGADIGICR